MIQQPPRARIFAGDQVRALRARLSLSQIALSRRIGISTSYLSQIESGDRPITGGVLGTTEVDGSTDCAAWVPLGELDAQSRVGIVDIALSARARQERP